jgi:hypothetical protein
MAHTDPKPRRRRVPKPATRLQVPPVGYMRLGEAVRELHVRSARFLDIVPTQFKNTPEGRAFLRSVECVNTAMHIELEALDDLGPETIEL